MTDPRPEPPRPEPPQAETRSEPWPNGLPYTVQFPDDDGAFAADLEHPAPLPRVGDLVDYIDERGDQHRYRVREVVHTLQTSAVHRPRVADGSASPDAIARVEADAVAERPGEGGQLRAGLPKVILEPAEPAD